MIRKAVVLDKANALSAKRVERFLITCLRGSARIGRVGMGLPVRPDIVFNHRRMMSLCRDIALLLTACKGRLELALSKLARSKHA
jgi:hypothetical protein